MNLQLRGQGKKWGEGIVREFGMDLYTALYSKWITNNVLLYSTWISAQCAVVAWMGIESGGEWTHVYVWLSPFAETGPETITTLLIGYTPVQNKKLEKKNKKT